MTFRFHVKPLFLPWRSTLLEGVRHWIKSVTGGLSGYQPCLPLLGVRLSPESPKHTGAPGYLYRLLAAGEEMAFWSYLGSKGYLKGISHNKDCAFCKHSDTKYSISFIQCKKFQSNVLLARCQKISKCWLNFLFTWLIEIALWYQAVVLPTCHTFYSLSLFIWKVMLQNASLQ